MQIPETPASVDQLDLMIRLKDYSNGEASWFLDGAKIGQQGKQDCQVLYTNIVSFAYKMLVPLLGKINAREMESFTMHDPTHSLKVAHLMWHILDSQRRDTLTPPEIALLVVSSFLHDIGMALSPQQREERLDPESDLWDHLELDESLKKAVQQLKDQVSDANLPEAQRDRARRKLAQAEEALLCQDTRERHATRQRYEELLAQLQEFHIQDPVNLPDVKSCLSFAGDSFLDKLIEICVSHNEDIDFLLDNDETNIERPRFPHDYIIGSCSADLHMVAAALRLADILDFDRERTPPVLYYYILPTNLAPQDDRSLLEWSKHLSISNWHIDQDAVVFRGHCTSHIIHHAVVQFCDAIENEIKSTLDTFSVRKTSIPLGLPKSVQVNIEQHGYTYVPYKFELDDHRVYELLMGGAIYDNSLVPARELVQNAVDACKLRDALTALYDPNAKPSTTDRITITYAEPTDDCAQPTLTVTDTGTGMDRWILENYFLKVGRSYYNSADFNKTRLQLRTSKEDLDFAPISEFGIGFLSCFLLADRLEVTTAMWEAVRGDTIKRKLVIDGSTRLIRLTEQKNEGLDRFKGTCVKLYLTRGSEDNENLPPSWSEISKYLKGVCQDLPYRLTLEHISATDQATSYIEALPLKAAVPFNIEEFVYRIWVNEQEFGLLGEIAMINIWQAQQKGLFGSVCNIPVSSVYDLDYANVLLRGGFKVGECPGLPEELFSLGSRNKCRGRIRLTWQQRKTKRYVLPTLSRSETSEDEVLERHIIQAWLKHLIDHTEELPEGLLYGHGLPVGFSNYALSFLETYDALQVYRLAKLGWEAWLRSHEGLPDKTSLSTWENSEGSSLPYAYGDEFWQICFQLLNLILPHVTSIQIDTTLPNATVVIKPPRTNWEAVLNDCHDFIRQPPKWPLFAEFIGPHKEVLWIDMENRERVINSLYTDEVSSNFSVDERQSLPGMLGILVASRQGRIRIGIPTDFIHVLKRILGVLGHLHIGVGDEIWRIDSFEISDVVEGSGR